MKIIDSIITAISTTLHPDKKKTVALAKMLKGKRGIEIGGPSQFFKQKSYYPAYLYAHCIDGVNFSTNTVWEGNIEAGTTYEYLSNYNKGIQYVSEAVELNGVENSKYDFLLSCHSLEHVANPIKALKRWHEVLAPNAVMALVLPNKEETFDANRPYTSFDHLLNDYNKDVNEKDATHFEEILKLHLIDQDFGVANYEELEKRTFDNYNNRCVHHHVFSFDLIKQIVEYCGFEVSLQKKIHGINLFTLAQKNEKA